MISLIDRDAVRRKAHLLPAFPRTIERLLATLDDPDANLNLLVSLIERDPALIARVLEQATAVATRVRSEMRVGSLFTAISLIGLARIRQMVITTSMAGFLRGTLPPPLADHFWAHSCSIGACAQQLALHCQLQSDIALIAGLLHDVGKLWLYRHAPEAYLAVQETCRHEPCASEEAERLTFGVDHPTVGAWLAEDWRLSLDLQKAIRYHHAPDRNAHEPLVALTHVAEVLSAALGLNGADACVTYLSPKACATLKLDWNESVEPLFGRITALSQSMAAYFRVSAPSKSGQEPVQPWSIQ